jgi:hypothetical protein
MRARLLIAVILGLWAWVLPIAHTMPIDADGPSGLSDNADFDDLIVRLTSPTAATPVLSVVDAACSLATAAVVLSGSGPVRDIGRASVEGRAPPRA